MKINLFSNLTFRALIYLALRKDQYIRAKVIAEAYGVSYHHLKKVMISLMEHGYVESAQGRNGGYKLAVSSDKINIGEVYRTTIENVALTECFASPDKACVILEECRLRSILMGGVAQFIKELDRFYLSDLTEHNELGLKERLAIPIVNLQD